MKVLSVTNLPIYLPADKAQVPFGDPLSDVTVTVAAPGSFTVIGYDAPVVNDAISFSFTAGGSMPAPLTAGTTYYVQSVTGSTGAFTVSATKGGAAITTTTAGANLTAHLLSNQFYGVTLPFKPSYTVVAENNTGSALTLQGAPDLNAAGPFGNPGGPGTFTTIAVIPAGGAAEVVLSYDWIKITTAAILVLQQN